MRRLRACSWRVLGLFRQRRLDREFGEELECHLQFDIEDGIRLGLSPEEARRQAILRLGGLDPAKEAWRDRRGVPVLESLARDIAYAVRMMRSRRAFTGAVVLTLALGIGATTAIFSVVNGVLLRPLPYPEPDRLVCIGMTLSGGPSRNPLTRSFLTYTRDYEGFRDHNRSLSRIGAYMWFSANLSRRDFSERVTGGLATRSFFELLGVQTALGRGFLPEEDAPGGRQVAILSDKFWRSHFGADRSAIGQTLLLDDRFYEIVGVLPPAFRVPDARGGLDYSLWLPLAASTNPGAQGVIARAARMLQAVGRLKPGITVEQAMADLDSLQQLKLRAGVQKRIWVAQWAAEITRAARTSLLIFLCAVSLLLLIACVNVANLLLSRSATREKEMAVRCAIGAPRPRIVQQLLIESVLLSLLGGTLGFAFAYWGKNFLIAYLAPNLPALGPMGMDWRVILFNLAVALSTGIAFGMAPALQMSKFNATGTLQAFARTASEGRSHQRLRSLLVVCEVAMAMILLSGAGLLVKSFLRLHGMDAGYNPDRILRMAIDLTESKYKTAASQTAFFRDALERIEHLPGVQSATVTTTPPFTSWTFAVNEIAFDGRPAEPAQVGITNVSSEYFRTLGVRLVRGRDLSAADREGSPSAILVNESFARRFCPDGDCLGKRLRNWDKKDEWSTIVGVVGDVRIFLEVDPSPEVYASYLQAGGAHMTLLVRTAGDPMSLSSAVRAQIGAVDNTQPPHEIGTMASAADRYFASRQVKVALAVVFASLALILGTIGIYSVISYSVKCRTHEIGIRLALGANPRRVVGMIMGSGLATVCAGVVSGLVVSRGVMRLISSELWGVTASDPGTFAVVASVIVASGFIACLLPAVRAARLDPMLSLRHE